MKEKRKTKVNLKRNFRKQKGITLIALIITIVLNCVRSGRKLGNIA